MSPATTTRRLPEVAELRAVLRAVRTTPTGARFPIDRLVTAGFLAILLGILHTAQSAAWNSAPPRPRPSHEEFQMPFPKIPSRGTAAIVAAAAAASSIPFTSTAAAQDAVQWRVEDGGNGHWYALVRENPLVRINWMDARQDAVDAGGDLACLGSAAEDGFVWSLVNEVDLRPWPWCGPRECGPYLGGIQVEFDPSDHSTGWQWIDGSQWSYTNWAPPEPFNQGGVQNYLLYWFDEDAPASGWGTDSVVSADSYIIEWSADCNADGIVDYGQILAGELDDTNGNNIPDCCEADVPCNCPADLDASGAVNGVDLAIILNTWGTSGGKYPQADIDGDGIVGGTDLALVLGAWGDCE